MSKSIPKNAMFSTILNLFNIILPILVLQIITNSIGDELYGYIGFSDSLISYFLIFSSFGIYTYGLREISRIRDNKIKLRQTFTSLFILTTFTNIISTFIYLIFIVIFYRNQPYFYTCIVMGLNLFFNMFYIEWVNQALENYDFIAIKTMIIRSLSCILIIFFINGKENYLLYLYLVVGTNFLNNIISFIYIKRKIKFDFSNLKFIIHIKPMIYAVIFSNIGMLYTQLDKFFIKASLGTTQVGFYYMAQKIMTLLNTLFLTIVTVSIPRLSNYLGNSFEKEYIFLLKKIIKIYFLFLFPACIGLFALSKEIILIFGNMNYYPVIPVLKLFSIYMLSLGIQNIISNQILYLNQKEKYDSILILIGGILNFILNSILVLNGKFTIELAIATTIVSNSLVIILEYIFVRKVLDIKINIFSFENLKYFYYSLIFLPIIFIIKNYIFNPIVICSLSIICCSVIYGIILLATKDSFFIDIMHLIIKKLKNI